MKLTIEIEQADINQAPVTTIKVDNNIIGYIQELFLKIDGDECLPKLMLKSPAIEELPSELNNYSWIKVKDIAHIQCSIKSSNCSCESSCYCCDRPMEVGTGMELFVGDSYDSICEACCKKNDIDTYNRYNQIKKLEFDLIAESSPNHEFISNYIIENNYLDDKDYVDPLSALYDKLDIEDIYKENNLGSDFSEEFSDYIDGKEDCGF